VKCWGPGAAYLLNEKDDYGLFEIPGWTQVSRIAGGHDHTCALIEDGAVECWGANDHGERAEPRTLPARVPNLTHVRALAAGQRFTCAAADDGSVSCWGTNRYGELGDGTLRDRATPARIEGLPPIVSLRAGEDFICALSKAAAVYCWGEAESGQVPDALPAKVASQPVFIHGLPETVEIAAGGSEACARTAGGAVYCWGSSAWLPHRRDDGPVMMPLPDTVTVALGGFHGCAITRQGPVLCFGNNQSGELGNGGRQYSQSPVRVLGLVPGDDGVSGATAVVGAVELRPIALAVTGPGLGHTFSKDVVQRVVRQNFGRFRLCYEQGLERHPGLRGHATARVEVSATGVVSRASVEQSDMNYPEFETCLGRAFGAIRFPRPDGGAVTFVSSISFEQRAAP
jgi:alpha-tubulin suppressor-like RCC1 family protein